jgi:glycosyltransferase involved in cell wall biosynthesis
MSEGRGVFARPANRAALARGQAAMAAQARIFEAFALAALRVEDPQEAAGLAQIAYSFADRRHPGAMLHAGLEARLHAIGRAHVPGDAAAPRRARGTRERILHVTTKVFATGGHTRVMERWIELDDGRESTVLLLRQNEPLPAALRATLERTGTPAIYGFQGTLLERARDLRRLAAEFDAVVLHISPFEIVPALAFADPAGRPPAILYNHASHKLWAGVAASDVVASLWQLDADDAVARRGVPAERSLVLPLPATPRALPDRAASRAALGLPADAPVLLCAASPYKLDPVLEPTFHDVVLALVEGLPDVHVLVAGPGPEHGLVPEHPRAHALGRVPDLGPHLAAADLLLDSWPASGATMMLDAAAAGLPCLALGGGNPDVDLIRPPAGLFDGTVTNAEDVPELVAAAGALLADAPRRAELSTRLRAHVARHHSEAGWRAALGAVMAAAREHHGAAAPPAAPPRTPPSDSEAVLQLLTNAEEADFTPYRAYLWLRDDLPASIWPRTETQVHQHVDAMLAAYDLGAPRAIAAPGAPAAPVIDALMADARRRAAAGEIASLAVVVTPEQVQDTAALLQAALETGASLDVALFCAPGLEHVAAPGDVLLTDAA